MLEPMLGRLRVLIVGASNLSRDALVALLRLERDLDVVGAIEHDSDAANSTGLSRPEVIITDFWPRTGAQQVLALRARWPETRILGLCAWSDESSRDAALRAGVDGYIRRCDSRAELLAALRAIANGERYVSRGPVPADGDGRGPEVLGDPPLPDGATRLSDREREVMQCVAAGLRTREIALRLSLSQKTVEKHRSNLMRKLGLRSAAAVAAYATAHGLLR